MLHVKSNGKCQKSCLKLVVCGCLVFLNIQRNNFILKGQIICKAVYQDLGCVYRITSGRITKLQHRRAVTAKRVRMKHIV